MYAAFELKLLTIHEPIYTTHPKMKIGSVDEIYESNLDGRITQAGSMSQKNDITMSTTKPDYITAGPMLNIAQTWAKFCKLSPRYPVKYTVYGHFRADSWVGLLFTPGLVLNKIILTLMVLHKKYALIGSILP